MTYTAYIYSLASFSSRKQNTKPTAQECNVKMIFFITSTKDTGKKSEDIIFLGWVDGGWGCRKEREGTERERCNRVVRNGNGEVRSGRVTARGEQTKARTKQLGVRERQGREGQNRKKKRGILGAKKRATQKGRVRGKSRDSERPKDTRKSVRFRL